MSEQLLFSSIPLRQLDNMIYTAVCKALSELPKPDTSQSDNSKQLLTVDELADLLRLTKPTIYTNFSKGLIPGGCKQGKRLYFDKEVIIDWIKTGRKLSNDEIEAQAEAYLSNKKEEVCNEKS